MSQIQNLLGEFETIERKFPGPIPWSIRFAAKTEGAQKAHRLVVGLLVHGNETGSLPGALRIMAELHHQPQACDVIFILGNPAAAKQNTRFIESDLNRAFASNRTDTAEARRANEIKKTLDAADLFLDLHQTTMPCVEPFYIFGYERESYLWARAIGGASVLVTRPGKQVYEPGLMCGDEYMRGLGRPAVTLELGARGINEQATNLSARVIRKTISLMAERTSSPHIRLESQARRNQQLDFYERRLKIPFTDKQETLVGTHQNLGILEHQQPIVSVRGRVTVRNTLKTGARIVFPRYPERDAQGDCTEPVDGDLIQILFPIMPYKS